MDGNGHASEPLATPGVMLHNIRLYHASSVQPFRSSARAPRNVIGLQRFSLHLRRMGERRSIESRWQADGKQIELEAKADAIAQYTLLLLLVSSAE